MLHTFNLFKLCIPKGEKIELKINKHSKFPNTTTPCNKTFYGMKVFCKNVANKKKLFENGENFL